MKKPYRSVWFNDEKKWKSKNPYDDVLQVGKQKAMGYICWFPQEENEELKYIIFNYLNNHLIFNDTLVVLTNSDSISHKNFPILYVGNEPMIQSILDKNKNVLFKSGWPVSAKEVFHKICFTDVAHEEDKDLYHLICDLFNSWCLWCEEPVISSGIEELLSKDPYDPDLDDEALGK